MKRSSNPAAPVLYGAVLLVAVATAGPASAQKAAFTGSEYATAPSSCQGMPPAGSSVNAGDARCGDSGSWEALPASTVSCLQDATRQHLLDRFRKGEIAVGPNASTAQAEFRLKNRGVTVRQYAWPVWVDAASSRKAPYGGCTAGLALPGEVRVSLREGEQRARTLIAQETANNLLAFALDRAELGDDAQVVDAAVSQALDACSSLPYIGN
ncbi:MAG: hypothetical protein U0529_18665 [Thermoanaerobaculia bacterium]